MEKQNSYRLASHWLCLTGLSGVFIISSVLKLDDLPAFYQSILSFQLISGEIALIPCFFVPHFELVCALALWVPRLKQGAALSLAIMTLSFILLLSYAWAHGIDVSCGCFGKADAASFTAAKGIARDILFLAMATWVLLSTRLK